MNLPPAKIKLIVAIVVGLLALVAVVRGVSLYSQREQPEIPKTEEERVALRAKIDAEELAQLPDDQLKIMYSQRKVNVEEAKLINEPVGIFEDRLKRAADELTKRNLPLPK